MKIKVLLISSQMKKISYDNQIHQCSAITASLTYTEDDEHIINPSGDATLTDGDSEDQDNPFKNGFLHYRYQCSIDRYHYTDEYYFAREGANNNK